MARDIRPVVVRRGMRCAWTPLVPCPLVARSADPLNFRAADRIYSASEYQSQKIMDVGGSVCPPR